MSFKDRDWNQRFAKLGDEAEGIFREVYPQGYAKFGLDRPPIRLADVPPFVRYTPDFITSKGLVEVQGFGRDRVWKLKEDKYAALLQWQQYIRVDFFTWDSHLRRYGWIRLPELTEVIDSVGEIRSFPENKTYWAVRAGALPVIEWIEHGEPLGADR